MKSVSKEPVSRLPFGIQSEDEGDQRSIVTDNVFFIFSQLKSKDCLLSSFQAKIDLESSLQNVSICPFANDKVFF